MALVETVSSMCCGAVLMLIGFWDTKKIVCDGLFTKTASDELWLSQKPFLGRFFPEILCRIFLQMSFFWPPLG